MSERFHLPKTYTGRDEPVYYEDTPGDREWQPEVYTLAGALAANSAGVLIDLGCGNARKLRAQADRYGLDVLGVDYGSNVALARENIDIVIEHDLTTPFDKARLHPATLEGCVVVCADVIEHLVDPRPLLRTLGWFREAQGEDGWILLSTPERTLTSSPPGGPPLNRAHVREWSAGEFRWLLGDYGLDPVFLGLTADNDRNPRLATLLALIRGTDDA
jgi:hypothetical protein